ncbi:hypothetical protein ACC699_39160, partial [Rhizobium ruizarguesonis]
QVLDAGRSAKGSARKAMRQTESAAKLYPASTLLLVAAVAGALAFAGRRAALPRHRPRPALRERSAASIRAYVPAIEPLRPR